MSRACELFIILSDFCNFRCEHCVTTSGPNERKFRITQEQIQDIVRWAKQHTEVKQVHFSGGEPTLHLNEIKEIQAELPTKHFAMTTNGWFGDKAAQILDQLRFDSITVSYDRYHRPFGRPDTIRTLLQECKVRGIRANLKFTLFSPDDIALLRDVIVPGIPVYTNRIVKTGRQRNSDTSTRLPVKPAILKGTCPSLEKGADALERVVYLPGRGITPCCGPLSSDKDGNIDFVHSSFEETYFEENALYQAINSGSFEEQAASLGISLYEQDCSSACAICSILYAELRDLGLPSLFELARSPKDIQCFAIDRTLYREELDTLERAFRVGYLFEAAFSSIHSCTTASKQRLLNAGIQSEAISDSTVVSVVRFFMDLLDRSYPNVLEARQKNEMLVKLIEFLKQAPLSQLYRIGDQVVGLIGCWPDFFHPLFQKHLNHIGVIGYDRASLTREQACLIKESWQDLLWNIVDSCKTRALPLSARIDSFNHHSLQFFQTIGFKPTQLELTKRI